MSSWRARQARCRDAFNAYVMRDSCSPQVGEQCGRCSQEDHEKLLVKCARELYRPFLTLYERNGALCTGMVVEGTALKPSK